MTLAAGLKAMLLEKAMAWNHGGGAFGLAHRRRQKFLDQSLDPGHNLVHLYGIHCGFISFNGSVLGDSLMFAKKKLEDPTRTGLNLGSLHSLPSCTYCSALFPSCLCFKPNWKQGPIACLNNADQKHLLTLEARGILASSEDV